MLWIISNWKWCISIEWYHWIDTIFTDINSIQIYYTVVRGIRSTCCVCVCVFVYAVSFKRPNIPDELAHLHFNVCLKYNKIAHLPEGSRRMSSNSPMALLCVDKDDSKPLQRYFFFFFSLSSKFLSNDMFHDGML